MQLGRVRPVRRPIGPLVSGLQSLPSVAWVPAAIIWFGLSDDTIYFVVLMGAVPSVANAMVSGLDQVPPFVRPDRKGSRCDRLVLGPSCPAPGVDPGGRHRGRAVPVRPARAAGAASARTAAVILTG